MKKLYWDIRGNAIALNFSRTIGLEEVVSKLVKPGDYSKEKDQSWLKEQAHLKEKQEREKRASEYREKFYKKCKHIEEFLNYSKNKKMTLESSGRESAGIIYKCGICGCYWEN